MIWWFAGFQCEEHDNPADFFLDVITSCERPPSAKGDSGFQGFLSKSVICCGPLDLFLFTLTDGHFEGKRKMDLIEYYRNSEQSRNIQEKLQPIIDSVSVSSRRKQKTPSYATSFLWQVCFLMSNKECVAVFLFLSLFLSSVSLSLSFSRSLLSPCAQLPILSGTLCPQLFKWVFDNLQVISVYIFTSPFSYTSCIHSG